MSFHSIQFKLINLISLSFELGWLLLCSLLLAEPLAVPPPITPTNQTTQPTNNHSSAQSNSSIINEIEWLIELIGSLRSSRAPLNQFILHWFISRLGPHFSSFNQIQFHFSFSKRNEKIWWKRERPINLPFHSSTIFNYWFIHGQIDLITVIISFHSIDFIHKFMKPINEKKTLVFLWVGWVEWMVNGLLPAPLNSKNSNYAVVGYRFHAHQTHSFIHPQPTLFMNH